MIIGIPLALDLWHYWDRWLALVGLVVVVFWGGAYVLMRWDERREERAKATTWSEAFKCKTPG